MEEARAVIECPHGVVDATIAILRQAGLYGQEGVVLWLGARGDSSGRIVEAFRPDHEAHFDRFWIPPEGMRALMLRLRAESLSLVAQVHSHPREAFHSKTDDKYAIVRHAGALSIVVPDFAQYVDPATFAAACAFFTLTQSDDWVAIPPDEVASHFEISPT